MKILIIKPKKKKIMTKKKNEKELNESNFFQIMKQMMILNLRREDIIKYFKKDRSLRSEIETRSVADYLSAQKQNIFFNIIRKISRGKLYTLVQNLTLDYYRKGDLIFLYKEPMNKFCIILEGTISLYLPYFIKKFITIKEFLNYFFYTKKNFPKSFVRVEKKNEYLFDGIFQLKINDYNMNCLSDIDDMKRQDFYIEEHQNVFNLHEGNQVNQISIIYNLVQNYNGYAKTDVYMLTLNKSDFIHILRTCLEDELSKEFGKLRKYCYIFNMWSNYSLAQIMNYYIPFNLFNKEIVYNQKEESDSFYIVQEGLFDVYCEISLDEFSQYKKYILKNNKNVIEWIKEQKEKKNKISVEKIIDYIQWKIKEEEYPANRDNLDKNIIYIKKKLLNKDEEDDRKLINLKVNEDILREKNKKILIKLFTLQKNDFIGLEDSLELKSRFYYVQCSSDKGILNKIRILDFIAFIASNHGLNLENVIQYVKERKNSIIERIYKNLNRELNNSSRTISHAYSLALASYEYKKKLGLKKKTDNIYKINILNETNTNKKLLLKIKEFNQRNQTNNINTENNEKDIRKEKDKEKEKDNNSKIRRTGRFIETLLLNQLNEDKTNVKMNKKWIFNDETGKREERRKRTQIDVSSYLLASSNTDRKIKSYNNKKRINKKYYIKPFLYNNDNTVFSKTIKNFRYKNAFPKYNLTINTLTNEKCDFFKNKVLSFINKKLIKEITNMTGIYNTKREISRKRLSHSNYKNQNKTDKFNSRIIPFSALNRKINFKETYIPNMNNEKIRNCINE